MSSAAPPADTAPAAAAAAAIPAASRRAVWRQWLLDQDVAWSQRLAAHAARPFRYRTAWLLARSGDSLFWASIIVLLFWRRQQHARPLLHTVAGTAAFVYAAKSLFRRGRPNGPGRAWRADRYAFPSGHAARAAAVALALTRERPSLTPPALLWAAAVALARVVLGRHYLTDVAGGLASGLLFAALLRRMTPRTISVGRNAKPAKKRQETPR